MKPLPIGIEDYLTACGSYYVDKTLIIKDIIDQYIGKSILITRPRRFGKSLMLSMIDYFFNIKQKCFDAFKDKLIYSAGQKYMDKLNAYPVIHLNMKNITADSYNALTFQAIDLISNIYRQFPELINSTALFDIEKEEYLQIVNKRLEDPALYITSILNLSNLLSKHYNQKVIILIDEYDAPLDAAFQKGFYDSAINFFKEFYSSTLKANQYALFSIVSGVLQLSKESIFSGLNNLFVSSVVNQNFKSFFGFTANEVQAIIDYYHLNTTIDELRKWYGGYGTKDLELFNPWSILYYAEERRLSPYWVNTGSTATIEKQITSTPDGIEKLNAFLNDEAKFFNFNNAISYRDLKPNYEVLFSLLVQTGFLVASYDNCTNKYNLELPNEEIRTVFEREIISRNTTEDFLSLASSLRMALLQGADEEFSNLLQNYIISSYSYLDLTKEKDYQVMIVGLLSVLFDKYVVKSEVNSKRGRCDIMISPKKQNDIGIIIELKKYKNILNATRLKNYAQNAIDQIKLNSYYDELKLRHCSRILLYGFAFDDKNLQIKHETIS